VYEVGGLFVTDSAKESGALAVVGDVCFVSSRDSKKEQALLSPSLVRNLQ
jgi:hypothetical protein